MIQISQINFGKEELDAIKEVISSGNVVQGKKVEEFEEIFKEYIGTKYAVAVSNGTSALCLSMVALEIGSGDEVITTPFSFIASANCILYTGAKPVFADINSNTFNIDPEEIKKKVNKKTKAILPVHLFGLSCEMDEIMKIARKNKLMVLEDACQAHGAQFKTKKVGSFGELACFSFYATKNITTIEGGMITTNSKRLRDKLRLLRSHGAKVRYFHDILGYNFRMTDLNAAIGIAQMKRINNLNKQRIDNANYMIKNLGGLTDLSIPLTEKNFKHVYHQYTVKVKNSKERKKKMDLLFKNGIRTEIYYPVPIHKQKVYKKMWHKESFPVAEKTSEQVFSLPIHPGLTKRDLDKVISLLKV